MPTRDEILDNILSYTLTQVAEYIHQGVLDRKDVNVPAFSAKKRKELDAILSQLSDNSDVPNTDDIMWGDAQENNTIEAYSRYLKQSDNGKHTEEARRKIEELEEVEWQNAKQKNTIEAYQNYLIRTDNGRYAKNARDNIDYLSRVEDDWTDELEELISDLSRRPAPSDENAKRMVRGYLDGDTGERTIRIISEIKKNPNLLSAKAVNGLYKERIFRKDQLEDLYGLDFCKAMKKGDEFNMVDFQPTEILNMYTPCTEVYFWGISRSGKSCLLASLLSVANSGKFGTWKPVPGCQGYEYMGCLSESLSEDAVKPLPPGTAIGTIYDMSFECITTDSVGLVKKREAKKYHPVTFIDIAGGMLDIMHRFISNPNVFSGDNGKLLKPLNNLTNIVNGNRGSNRKMHFFIIEYGAEQYGRTNNMPSQNTLLMSAMSYIESVGIFHKDTDAIYIVITKADKANKHGNDLQEELDAFLKDKYGGFYENIKEICRRNEISFDVIPFTIGEVKMQSYCKLNPKPSIRLLNRIMERTFSIDESRIGKLKKSLTE